MKLIFKNVSAIISQSILRDSVQQKLVYRDSFQIQMLDTNVTKR